MARIGPYTFEEFCEVVRGFHGSPAPGVLIGGFMVDQATRALPPGTLYEALCETRVCLPDAIQLLTPCTTGNGRLRVIPVGRYALTTFDKYTGEGARAYVDPARLDGYPELKTWFFKRKPKSEQDKDRLLREIREAGASIVGLRRVAVDKSFLRQPRQGPVGLCSGCGESYPLSQGELCGGCRGELPYLSPTDTPSADAD